MTGAATTPAELAVLLAGCLDDADPRRQDPRRQVERLTKEAVARSLDLTLEQGIRLEQDLYVLLQSTADRATGVRAFLAKRRPKFKGR